MRAPAKNDSSWPSSRSTWRRSSPQKRATSASVRSRQRRRLCAENRVLIGRAAVAARRRVRGAAASGRARTRSTAARSASDVTRLVIGLEPPEEAPMRRGAGGKGQRRVLDHGHGVLVLAACAGEARRDESDRCLTGTGGETVELERVSGEAHAAVQRADHRPRLTAAHRQVLASGEHAPALRVGERRVVDVVADVVLVHADCAVVRQRKVLRVDEVHGDLGVRRVLHPDVPQPRGAFLGEHQREGDAEPEPLAGRPQPGGVEPERERTARPEKWRPRDLGCRAAADRGWPARPPSPFPGTG